MNIVLGPIAPPAMRQAIWLLVLLQVVTMTLLTLLMGHLPGLSPGVEKSLFGAWVMLVGVPIAFTPLVHPHAQASHLLVFGLALPLLQVLASWLAQMTLI
ncbi:MAG: hypothetical protein RL654_960 [Pseudomonadota bacterium]|jgi:hypothetical protein